MKDLVSIIIPCHNAEGYLAEAIDSALEQSYQQIEVIVVDDGSTDSSRAIAKKYGPKIKFLMQPQSGPAAARNAGAQEARGKYIAFLDADDKLAPEFITASLAAMPAAGYTYTQMVRFGQRADKVETHDFDPVRLAVIGNYIGIGIVVKRSVFLNAGGFDEILEAYEDWDLWLKFLDRGIRGQLIDRPLYLTRWHDITRNPTGQTRLKALSKTIKRRHWRLYLVYWPQAKLAKLRQVIAGTPLPVQLSPIDPKVKLSIVIPNWNGRALIGDCLEALRRQTQSGLEVIVVDNGSSDESVDYISNQFPEVVLLKQPENLGFAGGVNVGIQAARGTAIALLNNDAVAKPDWAAELLDGLRDSDIVQAKILKSENPDIIDSAGDAITKWGLPYPGGRDQADDGNLEPQEIFSASGGAVAYRRRVFETIGLFDESFFAYIEDFDLCFRARLAGPVKIRLIPRAVVIHRSSATASKLKLSGQARNITPGKDSEISHFQMFFTMRNSNYLFYKDYPLALLLKTWPQFIVSQILLILSAMVNGGILVAIKAHFQVITNFPRILVKRRRIMKNRKAGSREIEKWMTDFWPFRFSIIGRWRNRLGFGSRTP